MNNDATPQVSGKFVVLQDGRRVSRMVHCSSADAAKERDECVRRLQENNSGQQPAVTVTSLLLG